MPSYRSILTLGVLLGAATLLAGCSATAGVAPSAGNTRSGGGANASCSKLNGELGGPVTAAVGTGTALSSDHAGGVVCAYGIGPNASLSGSALSSATTDKATISLVNVGGAQKYATAVAAAAKTSTVTATTAAGDKSAFAFDEKAGTAPTFFALKGDSYCAVAIDVSKWSELRNEADGSHTQGDAATVSAFESSICADLFG